MMLFQEIRSATVKLTYGGKTFLVDPWLAAKGENPPLPLVGRDGVRNPLVGLPLPVTEILQNVDAVIVTHTHFDHFDDVAKRVIPKDMLMFVQDEVDAAELRGYGFTNLRLLEADGSEYAGLRLYKTRCSHGQGEATEQGYVSLGMRRTTDACGVVLRQSGEKTVYLAGDTIWFDGVAEAIAKHQPDVIILNTARAEFPIGHPIIMGLADIESVAAAAPSAEIIASHMGAVSHAHITRADIKQLIADKGLANIWVPEDGEQREF